MIWDEFKAAAPALAALGEERFARSGVILLGTLRQDGFPRICPVEAHIVDGHLYLGIIWHSRKALDLLRDPRCTIHNTISRRDGTEGEFKLYGRAVEICDLEMRRRYCDALYEKIGWKPEEPHFHLFSVAIESAAFTQVQDGELVAKAWQPESGERVVRRWKPEE
jgi:hypothetical protein